MKDGSWKTPTQGTSGFPDITLARDGRVIFAELKTQTGRTTEAQRAWLAAVGGIVWRPEDWPAICALLDHPLPDEKGTP